MINFLHNFLPEPILISIGPINIFWYGIFIVSGILVAFFVVFKLADQYKIDKELIVDSSFWLILGGITGARIYHILLELPYYLQNPMSMIKIWEGGLAIHGAIIAGIFITWYFARKIKTSFWLLLAIFAPALSLAQAVGRWGNYFNQELFGKPTVLPWGIPILPGRKVSGYSSFDYFHPTFLYESIGNLFIFIALFAFHYYVAKKRKNKEFFYKLIVASYLILYSLLRFGLEFIRIDKTPTLFNLRLPQIISIMITLISLAFIFISYKKHKRSLPLE